MLKWCNSVMQFSIILLLPNQNNLQLGPSYYYLLSFNHSSKGNTFECCMLDLNMLLPHQLIIWHHNHTQMIFETCLTVNFDSLNL